MTETIKNRAGLAALASFLGLVTLWAGFVWLVIIFVIAAVLFLHELGHYVTARMTGMRVTEFFVGIGPKVWSFKRGVTEYGVKAIWVGAYVRIAGMNSAEEVPEALEGQTFRAQSYPKKLLVLCAGSGMHFVLALLILFVVIVGHGRILEDEQALASETSGWAIGSVAANTAASSAGILPGDVIVSVDNQPVTTFGMFATQVSGLAGKTVPVVVTREGSEQAISVTIGERITARGASDVDGLETGDILQSVEGVTDGSRLSYESFVEYAATRIGEPLNVTLLDANTGRLVATTVTPKELAPPSEAVTGFFGVSPSYTPDQVGLLSASSESGYLFYDTTKEIIVAMPKAVAGGVADTFNSLNPSSSSDSPERVAAQRTPVNSTQEGNTTRFVSVYGIARLGADLDGYQALTLIAYVNIFLGVFNLLPFLPLDGGHVAVATYERLRSIGGKTHRVDVNKLMPITYAVIIFLVLIGGVALVRDIFDPINIG